MFPFLKPNATVLVSSIPYIFSKPRVEDVVAFRVNGKIFIKRICSISENKYHLEGDNKSDSLDSRSFGLVAKSNILGKLFFIFPSSPQ